MMTKPATLRPARRRRALISLTRRASHRKAVRTRARRAARSAAKCASLASRSSATHSSNRRCARWLFLSVFTLDRYQSGIDHSLIDLESGMVNWYLRIPLSSLILLSSSGAVFSRDPLHRTAPMLWKT